jgi:TraM recognition site of TraD and TraG
VLWQFAQAVEARAALPPAQRHPFMAYVDEVAALGALPLPLDHLLERARGHGVGLTLAPQSLSQLSPPLRSALLANVGSLVAFRLNHQDATAVAAELSGVTARQLQHLEPFEVALRLSLRSGEVTPVMTGQTQPLTRATGDAAAVRTAAAGRYGLSLDAVDERLDRRQGLPRDADDGGSAAASLGTRRRQS